MSDEGKTFRRMNNRIDELVADPPHRGQRAQLRG